MEFSFTMSMIDFIIWLLNLPIYIYILTAFLIACVNIVIWYIKHPPQD